jgi:hypothetical protein
VAKHNDWTPVGKTAHLRTALNETTAHILQSVPAGAKYQEVTVVLEVRYGFHYLMEEFHA